MSSVSLLKVGKSPRGRSFRVSRGFLPFSSFFAAIRSVLSAIFGLPRLYFLVKVWVKRDCVSFKRIAREGGGEEISFSLLFLFAPLKTRLPERGKGGSFTLIFVPPFFHLFSSPPEQGRKWGRFVVRKWIGFGKRSGGGRIDRFSLLFWAGVCVGNDEMPNQVSLEARLTLFPYFWI